jgi:O-acetyl-ADP-ribose deacetylase (regulator of RNase III)
MDRCAKIMLSTTTDYLNSETSLEKVIFCLYGLGSYKIFKTILNAEL